MRRLAALAVALAVAGCGGGDEATSVPQGNPDERHGAQVVDAYASVELLRALLVASSDSYYAGGSVADARTQLVRARAAYDALADDVSTNDPVVDREVTVRFERLNRELERGIAPDRYRDLANPLADQLMDGVMQSLVPAKARTDRGMQAEALRRLTTRLAATYLTGAATADRESRLAFEESWGLWRRALALTAVMKTDLGPEKDRVAGALNGLRETAFEQGARAPESPDVEEVEQARSDVDEALAKRFAL